MSLNLESDFESPPCTKFKATYLCVPLVDKNKAKVERGGKLLLPVSALREIDHLNLPYPLIFKVTNDYNNRSTHAGVFEFTAEEGEIHVPNWLMKHLNLNRGDEITIESVSLPSATYCKLEPLTRNFAYISDTKTVLEENLRYFACLTEGDILFIYEMGKNQTYKVKIVETKPESAVCILDCEMELDLWIPEKVNHSTSNKKSKKVTNKPPNTRNIFKTFVAFKGTGYSLKNGKRKRDEEDNNDSQIKKRKIEQNQNNTPDELIFIREKQKEFVRQQNKTFAPFQGTGYSLRDS